MKNFYLIFLVSLFLIPIGSYSQLSLGTTGGLVAPTAQMQESGTILIGSNFITPNYLPGTFHYNTFNYYVNATIFPFLEFAYTCTFFRGCEHFVPNKEGKVVNQDRQFSARIRVLKEKKYIPAVVIGSNDLYSQTGGGQVFHNDKGNKYFSRFFLAIGKQFNASNVGIFRTDIAYNYKRKRLHYNDISINLSFQPHFASWLKILGEYYNGTGYYGLQLSPCKYIIASFTMKNKHDVTTGITFRINIKK